MKNKNQFQKIKRKKMISNAKSSKTLKSSSILSTPSKKRNPINKSKNKINKKTYISTSGITLPPSLKSLSKSEKRKPSANTRFSKEKETELRLKPTLKNLSPNFFTTLLNFWKQSSKKDSKN